jgi:hypothetical protein
VRERAGARFAGLRRDVEREAMALRPFAKPRLKPA